ncbi:MAG: hypothetical protein K1X65_20420 [Caldilineales bacterium]|nr:hypothetical protein [Caldilineales bacterium]MCW5862644.1 hypothetical protein [Anaerolineae bacterium]
MHESTLAIIDANIRSGQDELAREDLLARLRAYHEPCITPLWVNWLRDRADLRLVCIVHRLDQLDDFLIDVVREATGVTGASAVLSFGGRANIARLMDIPLAAGGKRRLQAATVSIAVAPGYDRAAFDAIWQVRPHAQVQPVWLLRTYHSYDADLNLFLLARDEAAITGFVMSWVRPIEGVNDTVISSIKDWELMATGEQMIELAEEFFHLEDHRRHPTTP